MSTTAVKKTTKTDRAAVVKARQAVVDEYGALDAELAPAKAKLRRFEELAKTIRGWHADSAPGLTIIERGETFQVVVGPKAETTILAPAFAICEVLGHERFLEIARTTLGELERTATAEQLDKLTRKDRIGSRSLKAIPA
jgi:hypothetical protein